MVKTCCVCRRERDKDDNAFGPVLAKTEHETTGFCVACFDRYCEAASEDADADDGMESAHG